MFCATLVIGVIDKVRMQESGLSLYMSMFSCIVAIIRNASSCLIADSTLNKDLSKLMFVDIHNLVQEKQHLVITG